MKPYAVLLVEDDESVRQLLQIILRKRCTSIDMADDGEQALLLLRSRAYDLVILDLMLPKTNGFAVAEAIRSLPKAPRVIVLSAVARYFRDRFPPDTIVLQKPFEIEKLDEVLDSLGLERPD